METAVSNISNDNSSSNSRNDEVSNLKPEDIHEHPNVSNVFFLLLRSSAKKARSRYLFSNICYFVFFVQITNRRRIFTSAAAGATAGAVAKTVIAPLDRTKIYFQTHPDKNYRLQGAVKFLTKTYRQDGVLSLWRGNSATMARIVPYAGIQFMAHEQYKRMFGLTHKDRRT